MALDADTKHTVLTCTPGTRVACRLDSVRYTEVAPLRCCLNRFLQDAHLDRSLQDGLCVDLFDVTEVEKNSFLVLLRNWALGLSLQVLEPSLLVLNELRAHGNDLIERSFDDTHVTTDKPCRAKHLLATLIERTIPAVCADKVTSLLCVKRTLRVTLDAIVLLGLLIIVGIDLRSFKCSLLCSSLFSCAC